MHRRIDSARPNRMRSARAPRLELLENRTLLCDFATSLSGGVLSITGTSEADSMAIVANRETGMIDLMGDGHVLRSFPAGGINRLNIDTLDGDDRIDLDPSLGIPTLINGGTGIDTISGWSDDLLPGIYDGSREFVGWDGVSLCFGVECVVSPIIAGSPAASSLSPAHGAAGGFGSNDDDSPRGILSLVHSHPHPHAHGDFAGAAPHVSHGTEHVHFAGELNITSTARHGQHASTFVVRGDVETRAAQHDAHGSSSMADGLGTAVAFGHADHAAAATEADGDFTSRSTGSMTQVECPTSSPIGVGAVYAAASDSVGVGMAANPTQAPKVGCKCLAMQAAAYRDSASFGYPHGYSSTSESTGREYAEHVDATGMLVAPWDTADSEACASGDDAVPACCRAQAVDQAIPALDDTAGAETESESTLPRLSVPMVLLLMGISTVSWHARLRGQHRPATRSSVIDDVIPELN